MVRACPRPGSPRSPSRRRCAAAQRSSRAPDRGQAASARLGSPAQLDQEAATGRLHLIEDVLEAAVAAVVRVGHVEIAVSGGVERAQQADAVLGAGRRDGAQRRDVLRVGAEDEVEGPRSPRRSPGARSPRARCRGRGRPRSRVGPAVSRHARRPCRRCRPRSRRRGPPAASRWRMTPSAVGDLQMFPMQTNRIRTARRYAASIPDAVCWPPR